MNDAPSNTPENTGARASETAVNGAASGPPSDNGSRERRGFPVPVKAIVAPSLLAFVCIYLLSGIYVVKPEQEALVTRFGELRLPPLPPGTHYRLPYPVDQVTYIKPNEVKSVTVGRPGMSEDEGEIEEYYVDTGLGEEFMTGDENIIHITMNIQYKVGDPGAYAKYLFNSVSPDLLVKLAAETALTDVVARTHVDDLMTSGKQWVLARIKDQAQKRIDRLDAGTVIIAANFASVSPPMEAVDAFKDVASALEDRDRFVNEATGEYNAAIPRARGEAEREKQEALALKESNINRAHGDADRFLATLHEFRSTEHTDISRLRLYIETMEEVMPRIKKYIVDTAPPDQPER